MAVAEATADSRWINLDNAATTPVIAPVAAAMTEALSLANPSSAHAAGRAARVVVDDARARIARRVGMAPEALVFTSGATEANNLAIVGALRAAGSGHIVVARTEHKAVLDPVRQAERDGWAVTWLTPRADGVVAAEDVLAAVRDDTRLVCLMHVNNEIGAVQDISAVGRGLADHRALLHVDAAQSLAWCPIDMAAMGIDLLCLSAHKCHGPAGIGALVRAAHARVLPILHGGGQEFGLRPGTLAVHQIAGFAAAVDALDDVAQASARVVALRERLWNALAAVGGVVRNAAPGATAPHILNVTYPDVDGASLIFSLPDLGVSQGSACTAGGSESSYVLRALGHADAAARASLRLSLSRLSSQADVDTAAERINLAVTRLRAMRPAVPAADGSQAA